MMKCKVKKKKVLQSFYQHRRQFNYLIEMNTNLGNFNAHIHPLTPTTNKKMDTLHTPRRHFLSLSHADRKEHCLNHQSVTNVTSCSFTGPNDFHNLEHKIIFYTRGQEKAPMTNFQRICYLICYWIYIHDANTQNRRKKNWHLFWFPKI